MAGDAAVTVRDGSPADAAALAPSFAALGYPAEPEVIRGRLAAMFADDPTARLLVAMHEGAVVGFATLHISPMPHRPTAVGRITALAVIEAARGTGAGRALVEEAERHFMARGITRLEVTSGAHHAAAHTFYEHLGYVNQGVRFAKPLPP
jgi:GNAT superfamily N-acetyltransferase